MYAAGFFFVMLLGSIFCLFGAAPDFFLWGPMGISEENNIHSSVEELKNMFEASADSA